MALTQQNLRVQCTCGEKFVSVAEWRHHRVSKFKPTVHEQPVPRPWWKFWAPRITMVQRWNEDAIRENKRHSMYSVSL